MKHAPYYAFPEGDIKNYLGIIFEPRLVMSTIPREMFYHFFIMAWALRYPISIPKIYSEVQ